MMEVVKKSVMDLNAHMLHLNASRVDYIIMRGLLSEVTGGA